MGTRLFEQYKSLGALSGTRERYSPSEASVSLEIVGIYTDLDSDSAQSRNPNWCYSVNTIFVPSSLLPISESELTDHEYTPSEFSFSVKAENIESFLEEASPKIEAMGLQLIFNDGGWLNISAEYKTSVKMSILKICILSAALITTTLFISYIYVYSRKKDYAIMRALGTSTAASVRSIILPILLTSILSVGLGLAIAWLYISKNIGSNETLLSLSVFIPNTDIFSWITIICGLAIILFIFFVSSVFLHHMNTVPILILLQSNGSKKRKPRSDIHPVPVLTEPRTNASIISNCSKPVSFPKLKHTAVNSRDAFSFIMRYILRHLVRSPVKSILMILLTSVLLCTSGTLSVARQSYIDLIRATDIISNFTEGIPLRDVSVLKNSGYIDSVYYEATDILEFNYSTETVVFTNDIARYTGETPSITYMNDYNDTIENTVILGSGIMEKFNLALGDKIILSQNLRYESIIERYTLRHNTQPPDNIIQDIPRLIDLYGEEIQKEYMSQAGEFIVAGSASFSSEKFNNMVFTPGSEEMSAVYGQMVPLDVCEAKLSDVLLAEQYREFGETLAAEESFVNDVIFVMDTEKIENLSNTLNLLDKLYPVILSVSLAIGGFICFLLVLNASKEASIMRILGTTKGKTRTIMALEQIFLCIVGLIVGFAGLVIYNGEGIVPITGRLCVFAGAYLAVIIITSVVTATLIMRRDLLSLLQTKE